MGLLILGALGLLASGLAALSIWGHAFRRSVGTGVIVLLVPCYVLLYAFSQYQHRHKGLILASWIGFGVLGAILFGAGLENLAGALPRPN